MRAVLEATTMSLASSSSSPPANANPLTPAITGCASAASRSMVRPAYETNSTTRLGSIWPAALARAFRSAPAQNARPVPVKTTTRTDSSASISSSARFSSSSRSVLIAFIAAGRCNRSQTAAPARCFARVGDRAVSVMSVDRPLEARPVGGAKYLLVDLADFRQRKLVDHLNGLRSAVWTFALFDARHQRGGVRRGAGPGHHK